jgi:hypothetical protein
VVVLGLYGLAKFFELGDAPTYRLGGVVSGHTLKHLCAGAAAFAISRHLHTRTKSSDGALPAAA